MTERLISCLGLFGMIAIAWALSTDRKKFPWRVVIGGVILQLVLAAVLLRSSGGKWMLSGANDLFTKIISFVDKGSDFVFGLRDVGNSGLSPTALTKSFAFGTLPTIIFFSTLMAVLYHLGVMQVVVKAISFIMQKTLKTSGPETLSAAANIFVGQTEAPLVVKPYIPKLSMSELNALMVAGFASTTGSLLAAYAQFGVDVGHMLTASLISAPAALLIAKVMVPEPEPEKTIQNANLDLPKTAPNLVGAASIGASEGLMLALNVGAMIIAFLALIAMLDWMLGQFGIYCLSMVDANGGPTLNISLLLGYAFTPMAALLGVEYKDWHAAGELMGIKMVANEYLAYGRLGEMTMTDAPMISDRTKLLMTYALSGFANFSSIGIQVGGIGAMAPERKADIARLGLRAMIGGTLACNMTACIAGVLL